MGWDSRTFAVWSLDKLHPGHDRDSLEHIWNMAEFYDWELDFSGGESRVIGGSRSRNPIVLRYREHRWAERAWRRLREYRAVSREALLDHQLTGPPIEWRWG